jgi:hypothetical protein
MQLISYSFRRQHVSLRNRSRPAKGLVRDLLNRMVKGRLHLASTPQKVGRSAQSTIRRTAAFQVR